MLTGKISSEYSLYQAFVTTQVPEAHTVGPVHPIPPHCPYNGAAVGLEVGVDELVVLGVELVELVLEEEATELFGLHQPTR